jgi:hypothetical protein
MIRLPRSPRGSLLFLTALCLAVRVPADPIVSEFMAANTKSLADADGDHSDWIELHNPDAAAVSLDGWFLTDSATTQADT